MTSTPPLHELNKRISIRFHDEVINGLDFKVAAELMHPEFVHERGAIGYTLQVMAPADAASLRALEGMERFIAATQLLRREFPEWHSTLEDIVAEGNKVVTRCTVRGRNRGRFLGTGPADGASFELPQIIIQTIEDGRIKAVYAMSDELGFWRVLGARLPA